LRDPKAFSPVATERPLGLIAELTHRCPLGCPYCSNPLALEPRDGELDTATWTRVFQEAATLGISDAHLSGGEPGARRDLVEIAASAREAGLYTSLITSGVGITTRTMRDLWEAGLQHVQVSFQDSDAVSADRIAGHRGAFQRKRALAAEAGRLGRSLTIGVVLHRANMERIGATVDLALALRASRIEITPVQYCGWARKNRTALMPTEEQLRSAAAEVEELRERHRGRIGIDVTAPDRYAGGWLKVTPSGNAMPCHEAPSIAGSEFWNVQDRALADIWAHSPVFNALRSMHDRPAGETDSVRREPVCGGDEPYQYRR